MPERIAKPKNLIVAAVLAAVVLLICLVLSIGFGWSAFRQWTEPAAPTLEPASFGYCGAELTELCVVSFGRDAFGNTIINLYVPLRKYPTFYLNIIRRSGESRYECEWNKNIRTSVYCVGDAIILGEGFEIQMFSNMDDRLLAQGTFTLTAFLITTQSVDGGASATELVETESGFRVDETATPTFTPEITETQDATATEEFLDDASATPDPSYP